MTETTDRQTYHPDPSQTEDQYAIEARNLRVYYGDFLAIKDVTLQIAPRQITAIIGPSGCGKSTMLRAFNRMNELIPTARTTGEVIFRRGNIYAEDNDRFPEDSKRTSKDGPVINDQ